MIVPAAISSIVGYTVYSFWLPPHMRFVPLFGDSLHHQLGSLLELLPMTVLALGLVAVGIVYIKTFYGIHRLAKRVRLPAFLRPAVGAALAGLCGLGLYYASSGDRHALAVLGTGYGTLQEAAADPAGVGMGLLFCVSVVKIVTTSLTIGSGGSGGVFGPSMVIGGCTGVLLASSFIVCGRSPCPSPRFIRSSAWPAFSPVSQCADLDNCHGQRINRRL